MPPVATATPNLFAASAVGPFGAREPRLEDLVLDLWEELGLAGRAECPICRGTMVPEGCLECQASLA
jgi:hypothetical protein